MKQARAIFVRRASSQLAFLVCSFAVTLVCAQPPSSDAPRARVQPIYSTSLRFVVTGLPAVDASTVARWADDCAARLERAVGQPWPLPHGRALELRAMTVATPPEGRVVKAQGVADGELQQRLVMVNAGRVDQEDLLEGLCWLALNRYAFAEAQGTGRAPAKAPEAPDWLAVGLAQNLFPELKARNQQMLQDQLAPPISPPSFPHITQMSFLPAGRWPEKAWCGLAVQWMLSLFDSAQRFPGLFLQVVEGGGVTADWMRLQWFAFASEQAMALSWREWVARSAEVQFVTETELGSLRDLDRVLLLGPRDLGVPDTPTNLVRAAAGDLIQARREDWAKSMAARLALRCQMLGLGREPGVRAVIDRYRVFYAALAEGKAKEKTLRKLLAEAETERQDHEQTIQNMRNYVNLVSVRLGLDQASAGQPAPVNMPEVARIQKYMDEAERRFSGPP